MKNGKKKGDEENRAWRRERKKKKRKGLRFPVFRRSEVVSPRIKVGLRVGYRNPNFSSKFQKVGFSPTLVPLNLRVVNGHVV